MFYFGEMKMFWNYSFKLEVVVAHIMNALNATGLWFLKCLILCYVNFTLIRKTLLINSVHFPEVGYT